MLLEWDDQKFGTGFEEIDAQHKELFRRINLLIEAIERNSLAKAEAGNLMYYLDDYEHQHFACEEGVMERHHCSACPRNKADHAGFVKSFKELRLAFDREGITPEFVARIHRDVVEWIENHVANVDTGLRTVAT